MKLSEINALGLKHGDKVRCSIEGTEIEDAKVNAKGKFDGHDAIWICQNAKGGCPAEDKLGYEFSWIVRNKYTANQIDYIEKVEERKFAVHTPTRKDFDRLMEAYEEVGWKHCASAECFYDYAASLHIWFEKAYRRVWGEAWVESSGGTIITVDEAIEKLQEMYPEKFTPTSIKFTPGEFKVGDYVSCDMGTGFIVNIRDVQDGTGAVFTVYLVKSCLLYNNKIESISGPATRQGTVEQINLKKIFTSAYLKKSFKPLTKPKMANTIKLQLKKTLRVDPEHTFIKVGIMDDSGEYTEEGKDFVFSYLAKLVEADVLKDAKKIANDMDKKKK